MFQMGFNDYRARYADMSTYAVGNIAYWDNAQSWGPGISRGTVTKVTKTQVTVQFNGSSKVFRWQPARRILIDKCGWNDYTHHELITPAAAEVRLERHNHDETKMAARNVIKTAAAKASEKWASIEDIEDAIAEMQAQVETLKALRDD